MEKWNVNDESDENLVIIIKLELEDEEEHNGDKTVDSKELCIEQENSENTNNKGDASFCDASKEIPNSETSEDLVLAKRIVVKCSPKLSTPPHATEPKNAEIEDGSGQGEINWNEAMDCSGKENLKNKCQKCLKDFANKMSLLLHIDDKHPEVRNPRPLPCKFCDDIFTIKPRLVRHMEKVHGKSYNGLRLREREVIDRDENFGVCRWCGKEYKRETSLRNHERLHTGKTPYNCELCGNSFEFKFRLDAHVRRRHKITENYVKDSHVSLNTDSSFKKKTKNVNQERWEIVKAENETTDNLKSEHKVIFHDDSTNIVKISDEQPKRYAKRCKSNKDDLKSLLGNIASKVSCRCAHCQNPELFKEHCDHVCDYEGCGKSFKRVQGLENHLRARHQEQLVCSFESCSEKCENYSKLRIHFLTHIGEPPFMCNYKGCGKEFKIYPALKKHMKNHTVDLPRTHSCFHEGCGKSFKAKQKLTNHLRTHTGEKPYICNECNKEFSRKDHLENHLRIHTGEKPYICNECNKGFSRIDHLKNHLRTHTEEKPLKNLSIHTGEKPYVCNECNKGFSRKDHLKRHLRTHTGEKPYVCKKCNRRFSQAPNWKKHTTRCVAA